MSAENPAPAVVAALPVQPVPRSPAARLDRPAAAHDTAPAARTAAPTEDADPPRATEVDRPDEPAGDADPPTSRWRRFDRLLDRGWAVALVGFVITGAVFRFATSSHVWLDESITIEIARRPVGELFDALRHDGAPPLYYLLLHEWIKLFGTGDVAVRALSGVLSLITLPLAWAAGRRVGRTSTMFGNGDASTGSRVATSALLLFAVSPYAIRYGGETRMYSLVVLLVLLFGLILLRALEQSRPFRLTLLTLATAALAYTHYWTFLLIFTVAFTLLLQARRRPQYRRSALRAFVAMALAAVPFAPWMPSFLFQMLHTGTPWAPRVQAQVLLDTVFDWAGPTSTGALLGIVMLGGALLGATARPVVDGLHVKPSGRVPGRYLAVVWLLPLVLAYFVNTLGGSAYTERYTGVALPPFLLLASLGIGLLPGTRLRAGVLVVAAVSGLVGGWSLARQERTQAGEIAARIAELARPGDVVAYCPDQLGPAVYRALERRDEPIDVQQIVYADDAGPALVDWVDYADRMQRASGAQFAAQVNELAGPDHAILFVRADGYRFLEGSCALISDQLASVRDRTVHVERQRLLEGATLERFSWK